MRRILSCFLIISFALTTIAPVSRAYAAPATVLGLPAPGTMVELSPAYAPVLMKGLRIHPENPLLFDFIIDTGHSGLTTDTPQLRAESEKLIKYFLATLTIPEKDLWVNLSPYEKDRMIPGQLGQTEMGRDMLAQDYLLKQLTASLIYPEKEMGKKFWDKVYVQARQMYGSAEVPVNTFNKVWILPDRAGVFVRNNTAYVVEGHLKVMLEEDYLAREKHQETKASTASSKVVRDIVLPAIEQEVNNGKNFAPLRQVFYSLVLASWYKKNLKEALLNQVYTDKAKTNGINVIPAKAGIQKNDVEAIYQQYLAAYKKGVFNYIKEDVDRLGRQPIPRKYFSGGEVWKDMAMTVYTDAADPIVRSGAVSTGTMFDIGTKIDAAMTANAAAAVAGPEVVVYRRGSIVLSQQETSHVIRPYIDRNKMIRRWSDGNLPGAMRESLYSSLSDARKFLQSIGQKPDDLAENQVIDAIEGPDIAVIGKGIYIKTAFASMQGKGSYNMLTRGMVYVLAQGTPAEKRVAEFRYAKRFYGNSALRDLSGVDYGELDDLSEQLRSGVKDVGIQAKMQSLQEGIAEAAVLQFNGLISKAEAQQRVADLTSDLAPAASIDAALVAQAEGYAQQLWLDSARAYQEAMMQIDAARSKSDLWRAEGILRSLYATLKPFGGDPVYGPLALEVLAGINRVRELNAAFPAGAVMPAKDSSRAVENDIIVFLREGTTNIRTAQEAIDEFDKKKISFEIFKFVIANLAGLKERFDSINGRIKAFELDKEPRYVTDQEQLSRLQENWRVVLQKIRGRLALENERLKSSKADPKFAADALDVLRSLADIDRMTGRISAIPDAAMVAASPVDTRALDVREPGHFKERIISLREVHIDGSNNVIVGRSIVTKYPGAVGQLNGQFQGKLEEAQPSGSPLRKLYGQLELDASGVDFPTFVARHLFLGLVPDFKPDATVRAPRQAQPSAKTPVVVAYAYDGTPLARTPEEIVREYGNNGADFDPVSIEPTSETAKFLWPGQRIPSSVSIFMIRTNQKTFGIAAIDRGGVKRVYVEEPFFDEIDKDPLQSTMAFIYALTSGSEGQKKLAAMTYLLDNKRAELKMRTGLNYDQYDRDLRLKRTAAIAGSGAESKARLLQEGVAAIAIRQVIRKINKTQAMEELIRLGILGAGGTSSDQAMSADDKIAQFEQARATYGDKGLAEKLGADYVGLYDYFIGQLRSNSDEATRKDIEGLFKRALWEIGANRLNGDIREVRVRTSEGDRELGDSAPEQGDAHVIYFALAANPLHYGQVETALRAMAQSKASQVVFRVQGFDYRKPVTGVTNNDRHEITDGFIREISKFVPGLFAYSAIGRNNDLDGETDYLNFLKLNAGRPGALRVDYLVGSDHMHYYAPDYKGARDAGGRFQPKQDKGGSYQADTIQKFDLFTQQNEGFLKQNNMRSVVLFNERDPKESEPMAVEEEKLAALKARGLYELLDGRNLEGASSTLIRNALAGFGKEADLTIMPAYVEDQIRERGQYRAFIIELPDAVRRLAEGKPKENDKNTFRNWLAIEKAGNKTVAPDRLAQMFSVDGAPVTVEQVSAALAALGSDRAMAAQGRRFLTDEDQTVKVSIGTSGWRTKLGKDIFSGPFNVRTVGRFAQAAAQVYDHDQVAFLVAYDARKDGDQFALYFAEVAKANGFDVTLADELTTTPAVIAQTAQTGGKRIVAFHITASHNPATDQGIKILADGVVVKDSETKRIEREANQITSYNYRKTSPGEIRTLAITQATLKRYEEGFKIVEAVRAYRRANPNVSITVDAMHGSVSPLASVFENVGIPVVRKDPMKNGTYPQGTFIEDGRTVPYRPEPKEVFLSQEDFSNFKRSKKGSMYLGIDGDADRLVVFVKTGDDEKDYMELLPNDLGVLYGWYMIKNGVSPEKKAIAKTQPTTYGLDALVTWANRNNYNGGGYSLEVTPVGSKHFGDLYRAGKLLLGVEESGHQVLPGFYDDATAQALMILQVLTQSGKSIAENIAQAKKDIGFEGWAYKRVNAPLNDAIRANITGPLEKDPRILADRLAGAIGKQIEEFRMTLDVEDMRTVTGEEFAAKPVKVKKNEGVHVLFKDGSWVMIRLSGTEPVARLYTESKTEEDRQRMQAAVEKAMFDQAMQSTPTEQGVSYFDDPADQAAVAGDLARGGIDFNPANLRTDVSGEAVDVRFDPAMVAQFRRGDFTGVRPIILKVTPIASVLPLLGLAP